MAKSDFLQLLKVWKHSSLHWTRNLQIYKAIIESKLMMVSVAYASLQLSVGHRMVFKTGVCGVSLASLLPSFQEYPT